MIKIIQAQIEQAIEHSELNAMAKDFVRNAAVDEDCAAHIRFDPNAESGQASKGLWIKMALKTYENKPNSLLFSFEKQTKKAIKKQEKQKVLDLILDIYHKNNGTPGYRQISYELHKFGIYLSPNTVYKYMKELNIRSITRRKYVYKRGEANEVLLIY